MDTPSTPDVAAGKKPRISVKRTLRSLVIALVSAVVVWTLFLKDVRVETDAVSPEIPRHSRVLIYRLARTFEPGDIVAYRYKDGRAMVARVVEFDKATGRLTVDRNDSEPKIIALSNVIGRAICNTR